jgi:hypothetical protein
MTTEAIAQSKQMMGSFGGAPGAPAPVAKLPTDIDEAKLKAEAEKLGEGVTFVSVKKLDVKGREGYVATYAFTDISKVKVTVGKQAKSVSEDGSSAVSFGPKSFGDQAQPFTFKFTKGNPSEMIIISPEKGKESETAASAPGGENSERNEVPDQMLPMLAPILKDMRISFVVDVEGKIVKTNATARQGSRLTLMDIEFGKLIADPAKFKELSKEKDPNSAKAKALLKSVPGITVETENPVRVTFK